MEATKTTPASDEAAGKRELDSGKSRWRRRRHPGERRSGRQKGAIPASQGQGGGDEDDPGERRSGRQKRAQPQQVKVEVTVKRRYRRVKVKRRQNEGLRRVKEATKPSKGGRTGESMEETVKSRDLCSRWRRHSQKGVKVEAIKRRDRRGELDRQFICGCDEARSGRDPPRVTNRCLRAMPRTATRNGQRRRQAATRRNESL